MNAQNSIQRDLNIVAAAREIDELTVKHCQVVASAPQQLYSKENVHLVRLIEQAGERARARLDAAAKWHAELINSCIYRSAHKGIWPAIQSARDEVREMFKAENFDRAEAPQTSESEEPAIKDSKVAAVG